MGATAKPCVAGQHFRTNTSISCTHPQVHKPPTLKHRHTSRRCSWCFALSRYTLFTIAMVNGQPISQAAMQAFATTLLVLPFCGVTIVRAEASKDKQKRIQFRNGSELLVAEAPANHYSGSTL